MNPHKGQVALEAKDKCYILRFSIDALCHLEAATGKPFAVTASEMAAEPDKVSMTTTRILLHAGLREHHPDLSLKEAGEIILDAGGMAVVTAKIFEAFALAFPQPEASGTPRPPKKPGSRGAGPAS